MNAGRFVAVGTGAELQDRFEATRIIDAEGRAVFQGFIDVHAHFYRYGLQLQTVDLTGDQQL